MAHVALHNLEKTYPGGFKAVRGISIDIAKGEFVVLVGPSGCGKSTALRMIAGLEDPTAGTITIDGKVVNDLAPADRDIAMVFQNYALYPHMTVEKNMGFALKMRGVPRDEIKRRVADAARLLGIDALLDRKPKALSGGQRQRVAVGRAIVREPKAFLFDEPLSNLDAKLRVTTRGELKSLQQRLGTTTIYVTHDQEEAMTMGDRIVVMAEGLIQQVGSPLNVYRNPATRFVAGFIGSPPMNFVQGTIARAQGRLVFREDPPGPGATPAPIPPLELALPATVPDRIARHEGRPVVLGLRPTAIKDAPAPNLATLHLIVKVTEPLGEAIDALGHTHAGTRLVARLSAAAAVNPATPAVLGVDMTHAHVFAPGDHGRNLALEP